MTKNTQSPRQIAIKLGYDIREGSYQGTTDDILGTWYIVHKDDTEFRPYGRGYKSQKEAWIAAAERSAPDDD